MRRESTLMQGTQASMMKGGGSAGSELPDAKLDRAATKVQALLRGRQVRLRVGSTASVLFGLPKPHSLPTPGKGAAKSFRFGEYATKLPVSASPSVATVKSKKPPPPRRLLFAFVDASFLSSSPHKNHQLVQQPKPPTPSPSPTVALATVREAMPSAPPVSSARLRSPQSRIGASSPKSKPKSLPYQTVLRAGAEEATGYHPTSEWRVATSRAAVVRAGSELTSQKVGDLLPGSVVEVHEFVTLPDGSRRARTDAGWITAVTRDGRDILWQAPRTPSAADQTSASTPVRVDCSDPSTDHSPDPSQGPPLSSGSVRFYLRSSLLPAKPAAEALPRSFWKIAQLPSPPNEDGVAMAAGAVGVSVGSRSILGFKNLPGEMIILEIPSTDDINPNFHPKSYAFDPYAADMGVSAILIKVFPARNFKVAHEPRAKRASPPRLHRRLEGVELEA